MHVTRAASAAFAIAEWLRTATAMAAVVGVILMMGDIGDDDGAWTLNAFIREDLAAWFDLFDWWDNGQADSVSRARPDADTIAGDGS